MAGTGGVMTASDVVDALRRNALRMAALQADQLRLVAELDAEVRRACQSDDVGDRRGAFEPDPLGYVDGLVRDEVVVALGVSPGVADQLVGDAARCVSALPAALDALASGVLDAHRLRALVEGVAQVDDDTAAVVTGRLLSGLEKCRVQGPWDGPSTGAWRQRIARAVAVVDASAQRRRRQAAVAGRRVRCWANGDGTGTLQLVLRDVDARDVHATLRDLADRHPSHDLSTGEALTVDQRMADAAVGLFARVAAGDPLPVATRRRERDVGVVLHVDTLVGDGPAASEPGELRGLAGPAVLDAVSAREVARDQLQRGRATSVLLVDDAGALQRLVRLATPCDGWTRRRLIEEVRAALPKAPLLEVGGYAPTPAIVDHVRAARPRCSAPGCRRPARRCDLDHDTEWPRGPTSIGNLDPKCRRHHGHKTRRLWRSRLHADGSVSWTTLLGTTTTTRHEPLPGWDVQ